MDNRLVDVKIDNTEWSLNILYAKLKITSPTGVTINVYKKTLLVKSNYEFLITFLSNFNKTITVSVETLLILKNFTQC